MSVTDLANHSPSALSDLHNLIASHNPFDRSPVVRTHDVWEQKFPDVPSINGHISDAIFQGIEQIRLGQRSVLGVTITAEKGLGKSHLISRLRRRFKEEGTSFFVYMSETDYSDLNRINSQFLSTLAYSLKQSGSQGVMQWQEIATFLVNQAYNTDRSPEYIIKQFPGAIAKRPALVDQLTAKICQLKPDIRDPYVVQAILWTLSPDRGIFAINWLSGSELTQTQADAMGLPVVREEDRESRALNIASQVLDLVGDYQTTVICFDEAEPKNTNAKGLSTPQVVALLAKDLYSKLKRGILMLSVLPDTWTQQVKVMPQAESIADRIGEKYFDLKYLNSDHVIDLVSTWLKLFYDAKGFTPPTPTYPFDENELRDLGKERPIARRVLKWCCENWEVPGAGKPPIDPPDSLHQVEVAFQEQMLALDRDLDDYLEDSGLIGYALLVAFWSLEGQKVGQVMVEEVQDIEVTSADQGYLDFRIVGQDNGKTVKIGVCVLQESGARYVSAALKRLIDYKKFDLTRGCLVRSKAVRENTHGHQHLNRLLTELGGEWVLLKPKDIQALLAVSFVFAAHEEYEFEQEQVFEFMRQRKIAESSYLVQEILSDPSGQIPHDAIDEDQFITSGSPFAESSVYSEVFA
ncbi:P-loop NTPase fold protein [Leptolyngbya sp. NIES-2104]|uniref:P-loop NTPase fold protein n=1 Tax=Leptolyngbya sp. NIES-2104 TaxID=1552121 RepID=UPI00073EC218|nr:P-loop NTPase fold protein [Leptolyngbya sp. NIES-2104]